MVKSIDKRRMKANDYSLLRSFLKIDGFINNVAKMAKATIIFRGTGFTIKLYQDLRWLAEL